jgi:hypothetical protein
MLSPSYDEDMEDNKDIQKDTGWSLQRYEMVCAEIAASLLRCFKPRECLCHNNISRLAYDVSSSCRRQSLLFDCDRN